MQSTNNIIEKKNRIGSLDIIRTIAILLVVINHCAETVYKLRSDYMINFTESVKIFALSNFTLGRVGVPLFLFLTGYLVVSRSFENEEKIKNFYLHKYIYLLITCEIWIIIYNILNCLFLNKQFDMLFLLRNMLFLESIPMMNAWYIPMILGVYIFIPYVSKILHSLSNKSIIILGSIVFVYYFIIPFYNIILNFNGLRILYQTIDLNYSGGGYGFYLLLGFCCYRHENKISNILKHNKNKVIFIFLILLLLSFTVLFQYYLYKNNFTYNVWYNFPTLPVIGFFCICVVVSNKKM